MDPGGEGGDLGREPDVAEGDSVDLFRVEAVGGGERLDDELSGVFELGPSGAGDAVVPADIESPIPPGRVR